MRSGGLTARTYEENPLCDLKGGDLKTDPLDFVARRSGSYPSCFCAVHFRNILVGLNPYAESGVTTAFQKHILLPHIHHEDEWLNEVKSRRP